MSRNSSQASLSPLAEAALCQTLLQVTDRVGSEYCAYYTSAFFSVLLFSRIKVLCPTGLSGQSLNELLRMNEKYDQDERRIP